MLLAEHGIRGDPAFSDVASGRNLQRSGWQKLTARLQGGDTIVVAFLDRLSRNFEDGVRIQAELTRRNIGVVAIRENIDTRGGSVASKFFRRRCWRREPTRWILPARGPGWGWTGPAPVVNGWDALRRLATTKPCSASAWLVRARVCATSPASWTAR